MSNAHTPGPWHASYTKFSQVVADNGAMIATCERLGSLTALQANARVIAVAPSLLHIAKRLAAIADGLRNGNSAAEDEAVRLAELARIEVAKATGERA